MMRTAQLIALLLLVGFLGSNAWAGDADRFRELISGEQLTEEELAQYYGRGVNLAARVRFAETFAETFLESASENHTFTFSERFRAARSLKTTGVKAGVRMPTATPTSRLRTRIAELRTVFRSKF
jgi:hypothetical protein